MSAAVPSQQEIDALRKIQTVAERVRAGGLPDFMNRWLTMTPDDLAEDERRRAERKNLREEPTMRRIESIAAALKKPPLEFAPLDFTPDVIGRATSFTAKILTTNGWHDSPGHASLDAARTTAEQMQAGASRQAMVYAVLADGRSVLVPREYQPAPEHEGETDMATKTATAAKTAKKTTRKDTARAKPARKAAGARKAVVGKTRPAGKSKLDVVHDLLIRENGATRAELSTASGWPHVNLKASAERADMDLVCLDEAAKRFKLVAKPEKKG